VIWRLEMWREDVSTVREMAAFRRCWGEWALIRWWCWVGGGDAEVSAADSVEGWMEVVVEVNVSGVNRLR
jgi:hypothetical protein